MRGSLNSAGIHLEVLKRAVANDPIAADSLRTIVDQLARLAAMLPDVLAVTAIEVGPRQPVSLRAVAAQAAEPYGSAVVIEEGEWPLVFGDAPALVVALGELIGNAVEATKDGSPPPRVTATPSAGEVVVSVRDRGEGLRTTNPKLLVRLGQSAKPGHRGYGLLVAERVARLHGGRLTFESTPEGATVSLVLPAP
ncbi:MAG TPA: HAMP domain-containing sensor histidine kinase [Candidatus Limnocylindria bacterium]|nr:HAMP domain-containing sensor histidine kinase [Candidatus Limnocylindria bacterium]